MVKRIAPIRVISFFLLATCGALCQSAFRWLASGLELNGSESHELQRQELGTWKSLPDAPSSQPPTQAEKFRTFIDEARSSLTLGAVAVNAGMIRETELGRLAPGQQPSLTALYKGVLIQKESSAFFGKYLYPSLLKQDPRYYPSSSGSFLGRATYAALPSYRLAKLSRRDHEKYASRADGRLRLSAICGRPHGARLV